MSRGAVRALKARVIIDISVFTQRHYFLVADQMAGVNYYQFEEDEKGNPLGYHRTTQKSKWNDASQRYEAWKEYVRSAFYKKYTG